MMTRLPILPICLFLLLSCLLASSARANENPKDSAASAEEFELEARISAQLLENRCSDAITTLHHAYSAHPRQRLMLLYCRAFQKCGDRLGTSESCKQVVAAKDEFTSAERDEAQRLLDARNSSPIFPATPAPPPLRRHSIGMAVTGGIFLGVGLIGVLGGVLGPASCSYPPDCGYRWLAGGSAAGVMGLFFVLPGAIMLGVGMQYQK